MFNFFKKKTAQEPAGLCIATDIHCHLIPGVDDGSPDMETSVALIKRMQKLGFKRIFASPHITQDTFENTQEELDNGLNELKAELTRQGIDIFIDRSAEYRIDEYSLEQINSGKAKALPNGYIIVENSFIQEPWQLDKTLFDIKVKGYKTILAHPERYFYYHNKRNRYDELHNAGTLFQINLLSLAGYYGKDEKIVAEYLVDKGYVDFLGSDIHRMAHIDAIENYLTSKDYKKIAPKLNVLNDSVI